MLYHSVMPESIELGASIGFAPMLANSYFLIAPRYLSPKVREVISATTRSDRTAGKKPKSYKNIVAIRMRYELKFLCEAKR